MRLKEKYSVYYLNALSSSAWVSTMQFNGKVIRGLVQLEVKFPLVIVNSEITLSAAKFPKNKVHFGHFRSKNSPITPAYFKNKLYMLIFRVFYYMDRTKL